MNEGFKALPEYVQKKIDPEMAKKFAMGGGVMQRPLFRQMGGPAQPMPQDMMQAPPMPQGMMQAQPDPQAMVQEAEMAGERVGEQIAAQTMTNIDSATDVKGAIDALRGNAAPLEERYQELAGFVGERDASQTPESVLALTQPAIMMTEQGAMDSGIGELMQTVAGDSEMSGGMDQGVGALMMQGAGNTPPENFRQGGPVEVQRFANGNEVVTRAGELQSDFLPLFEQIYGTAEERQAELEKDRQLARSQMMFDIGKAGLAFAGETQGGSIAERLANALNRSGTFDSIGQRAAGLRALEKQADTQDQTARASALQTAISQVQNEMQAEATAASAKAKLDAQDVGDVYNITVKKEDGTTDTFRSSLTKGSLRDLQEKFGVENVSYNLLPKKPAKPNNQPVYGYNEKGSPIQLGLVDMDQETEKVNQDIALLAQGSLNGEIIDKERYKTELNIQEYFAKGPNTTFVEATSDFDIVGTDGSKIPVLKGEVVPLNDRQITDNVGKFRPYKDREYTTLYSKTAMKIFPNSQEGQEQADALIATGDWSPSSKEYDAYAAEQKDKKKEESIRSRPEIISKNGKIIEVTKNKDGTVNEIKPLGTYEDENQFGKSNIGLASNYFNSKLKDPDTNEEVSVVDLYAQNKLGEDETRVMETFITNFTAPETTVGGVKVASLPNFVELAIIERLKRNLESPVPLNSLPLTKDLQEKFGLIQPLQLEFGDDGKVDYSKIEDMPSIIIGDVDLTNAQGFMSGFNALGNFIAGQLAEVGIGSGVFSPSTMKARDQLDSLARRSVQDMRAAVDGKVFSLDLKMLEDDVKKFMGGGFKTDAAALSALETIRSYFAKSYNKTVKLLEYNAVDPAKFTPETIEAAEKAKLDLESLLGEYTAAIMSYKYAKAKSLGAKTGTSNRRRKPTAGPS